MECFLASVRLFPVIKAVKSSFFNVVNACFALAQYRLRFLPLFARVYRFAGIEEDVFVKVLKRIQLDVIIHMRSKFYSCLDVQFSIESNTCIKLQIQWCLRTTLLSCDIEINPGPETLDFCCWNLNSIAAHDFLRVSLMDSLLLYFFCKIPYGQRNYLCAHTNCNYYYYL